MVFHSRLLGCKGGNEARLPASTKASGTTRRIYVVSKGGQTHLGPRAPTLKPSLPSPDVHTPFPAPHALQLCALEPPGAAWDSPTPSLRPGAICGGAGRGEVALTAASAPALSSKRFVPQSTRQALGTPPYPAHTPPLGARNPLPTLRLCRPL